MEDQIERETNNVLILQKYPDKIEINWGKCAQEWISDKRSTDSF